MSDHWITYIIYGRRIFPADCLTGTVAKPVMRSRHGRSENSSLSRAFVTQYARFGLEEDQLRLPRKRATRASLARPRHISGLVAHGCIIPVARNGNLEIEMHPFASQQLPQWGSLYDGQNSWGHANQPQFNAMLALPLGELREHFQRGVLHVQDSASFDGNDLRSAS